MDFFNLLDTFFSLGVVQRIAVMAIPMVLAVTVHEAAHGYAARYFGDMTAYHLGRISLNPIQHIDPIGTILIPALTMYFGGVLFGWAKPVPVNFMNLRNPKRDMMWVAAAGPAANLIMALVWAMSMHLVSSLPQSIHPFYLSMCVAGIFGNTILMVLNLLPLPPLDGGRIAVSLLPNDLAAKFSKIEPYGFVILIILLSTHILDKILWPPVIGVLIMIQKVIL